jgi:hypothetical protein
MPGYQDVRKQGCKDTRIQGQLIRVFSISAEETYYLDRMSISSPPADCMAAVDPVGVDTLKVGEGIRSVNKTHLKTMRITLTRCHWTTR